jgi:hypothetical protein
MNMMEEEEKARQAKQSEDVEMVEESKDPAVAMKLTGAAAKAQMKQ